MIPPSTERKSVKVQTTLPAQPYPPLEERKAIRTARLFIRPCEPTDLTALHELRLQPDVMCWTGQGKPDADLDATREKLNRDLAPGGNNKYNYAICDGETGVMIGIGGCHIRDGELGWPVIGYMFRREAWGKGYGQEFVKAFLEQYWALPRVVVQDLSVEEDTVELDEEMGQARECIVAVTSSENQASHNVLRKTGWKPAKTWGEPDWHNPEVTATLVGWTFTSPVKSS